MNIVYWGGEVLWGFYIVGDECFELGWSCKKHENHFMVKEHDFPKNHDAKEIVRRQGIWNLKIYALIRKKCKAYKKI